MRFGINTFLFTSPFTTDSTRLFKQLKRWGFHTVEIPIEDPSHIEPAHVKRELAKHGLVCGSVCACMGPDRDLRGTPQQQTTGLNYMLKLLDQMAVLDCPSLIGPVYSAVGRADAVPPAEYKQQWKTVVRHLKTLCTKAESRRQQVCLEPLNRFETDFINTCDQALQMVKDVRSPALKIHLDTFHKIKRRRFAKQANCSRTFTPAAATAAHPATITLIGSRSPGRLEIFITKATSSSNLSPRTSKSSRGRRRSGAAWNRRGTKLR